MSNFILKIVAIITMFLDHLGYALYDGQFSYLNYIGRLAFPIFAFGISEGYLHTRSKKNYLMRLFMFAIISQAPFMFFCSIFQTASQASISLNIFFTLFLGLVSIIGYENCKNKYIGLLLVLCLGLTADAFNMDYGYWGVFVIFIFHIFKEKKTLMNLSYIGLCLLRYLPLYIKYDFYLPYLILCACTILPLVFINLYNGKKGPNIKYLLYGFYPVHLMLLYVFNMIFI